jgi:NTP pyrophosphatase (non-canonical NTP hydrolase)
VIDWCSRTFGDAVATDPLERAARLIEEAIELVQACGLPADRVADIARHVYSKPVGEVAQEVGGVGVTLLALADVFGVSAELEERREVLRVLSKDPAHFRARQDAKAAAGVARVSEVQA